MQPDKDITLKLFEALHKEGTQGDHVSVGWQLPNATYERPIPGIRLSPFVEFTPGVISHEITGESTMENINQDYGLKIFPNPTTGQINIVYKGKTKAELKLRITTIIGQVILEENYGQFKGELTKMIDMSKKPKGIYLLEIISGDETIREKLLLED